MQFLFWLANHSLAGQRSLEDVIGIFGHQLRALGHQAVWEVANDKLLVGSAGINVVVEGFSPASIKVMADAHAQGARFVIMATEEPTPSGFNHGWDKEMVGRQAIFHEAARYAEAIFHLVPGEAVNAWYRQFAPAAAVELGYAPSLVRGGDIVPDFDFGFYGAVTNRRLRILKKLARVSGKEKGVKIVADFATQAERDQQMRRAKVIVQIRKHEKMGLVSSSRCNTVLCLGRPILAEPHDLSHPWDEVVRFSRSLDRFYEDAVLVKAAWKGVHADQFAKFKAKMSPQECVGRALDQVGLLTKQQAA